MGNEKASYRKDIDGLRAIAVLAVIVFHLGYLPNGYLGVDVFFVISGYLITGIIYREMLQDHFSMVQFYLRRTRRIIPLVTFINIIALIIGIWVMLPDDLENLSQSIVATNFFSNNILQFLTTKNYWDVINEYKPLMHTWSLGIEEQFYLFYPLLFILFGKKHFRWLPWALFFLTLISLGLFLNSFDHAAKFYLLPFRFFELSLGGLGAILFARKKIPHPPNFLTFGFLIGLLLLLSIDYFNISPAFELLLAVFLTLGVLLSLNSGNKLVQVILENKIMVAIGKISFSLYMWHHLVLAFNRYFISSEMEILNIIFSLVLIFGLSVMTFFLLEQPFRDKKRITTPVLLWSVGVALFLSSTAALYLNHREGVLYDIPELDISVHNIQKDMHPQYNHRIYDYDKPFSATSKVKIFIIGDSFGRDWANVLLESEYSENLKISYTNKPEKARAVGKRYDEADLVFFTEMGNRRIETLIKEFNIDRSKIRYVGTKNFGISNGIFFANKGEPGYCLQSTKMEAGIKSKNSYYKQYWGEKYIDLIDLVSNEDNTVPVFTPDCKFISHDGRHLTQSGAKYFANLIENKNFIFNKQDIPGKAPLNQASLKLRLF